MTATTLAGDTARPPAIVPREQLDFDLEGDIPRYWFGGDPFKTRFFDAMSTIFPEGERFFISCVRDFRDQVADPKLKDEIRDFIRQEGQHGMIHDRFNNRLRAQGIDVDKLERIDRFMLFDLLRKYHSRKFTLAVTAASEHMTAIMAHSFCARREVMEQADPRMRAMYTWHAMEEVEHKAVAFDVMQKVAGVGYARRMAGMLHVSIGFPLHVFLVTRYMLKVDGHRWWKRPAIWARGLWWLYKPGGLFSSVLGHYLAYFKPGFHPWQDGQMDSYRVWLQAYQSTGNPIAASQAVQATLG